MKKILSAVTALAFVSGFIAAPAALANPSFSNADSGTVRIEESGPVYNIYSSNGAVGAFHSFSNQAVRSP